MDQLWRDLVRPVPLTLLRTQAGPDGRQATLVVAGSTWAEYLPSALLKGPFEYSRLGRVPLWQLPRVLRAKAPSASLVIARTDRLAARWLFGPDYLHVPDMVDLWLDVPQDLGSLYRGKGNSTLRNDLNRADRNGLSSKISHDEADLVDFLHRFHVPFVSKRFERYASPHNLSFLRGYFPFGGLIWVMYNGQRIAGCVFGQPDRVPTAVALGTVDGDYGPVELGAYTVILRTLVEHVHELGCGQINFGGSRPLLTNGSLRYKRKWGMRVARRPKSRMLALRWEHLHPWLVDMLTHSGLIFEHQGQLSAVSVLHCSQRATAEDVNSAYHFLRMPGLRHLHLCSRWGFEPGIGSPPGTRLIDLAASGHVDLIAGLTAVQVQDL